RYLDCSPPAISWCQAALARISRTTACTFSILTESLLLEISREPKQKARWPPRMSAACGTTIYPCLQPACVPQGHTQDQPGPLKNVPTTVKQSAVAMNHVITHHESGFCRSAFIQPAVAFE